MPWIFTDDQLAKYDELVSFQATIKASRGDDLQLKAHALTHQLVTDLVTVGHTDHLIVACRTAEYHGVTMTTRSRSRNSTPNSIEPVLPDPVEYALPPANISRCLCSALSVGPVSVRKPQAAPGRTNLKFPAGVKQNTSAAFKLHSDSVSCSLLEGPYSEQSLLRIWAWGGGPHIILNRHRVGVAIVLNGPFFLSFLWAWWGIYIP